MDLSNYISVPTLCTKYSLDVYFFEHLSNQDVIQIIVLEDREYIEINSLGKVEQWIRIHKDLEIPVSSLDVVINLLEKIETLQEELKLLKNNK